VAVEQLAGRKPLWGSEVKYSDQLANGDADDDKELEDEDDPEDMICDDNGFVRQWPNAVQLENDDEDSPTWDASVKYSDQLANGDKADDKELEDEDDPNDLIADDNGFVRQWPNAVQVAEEGDEEEEDDEEDEEEEQADEQEEAEVDSGDDDSSDSGSDGDEEEDSDSGDDALSLTEAPEKPKDKSTSQESSLIQLRNDKLSKANPTKKEEETVAGDETKKKVEGTEKKLVPGQGDAVAKKADAGAEKKTDAGAEKKAVVDPVDAASPPPAPLDMNAPTKTE